MLDYQLIEKKIDMLSNYVDKLKPLVTGKSIQEVKDDDLKLSALERYFQLAVDQMIDINTHIIRENNFGTIDDLQSTFKMLGSSKVLEDEFANKIAPIVGARNMLVHRYDKLDKDIFLNNLQKNFDDFKKYIIQIYAFLKKEN